MRAAGAGPGRALVQRVPGLDGLRVRVSGPGQREPGASGGLEAGGNLPGSVELQAAQDAGARDRQGMDGRKPELRRVDFVAQGDRGGHPVSVAQRSGAQQPGRRGGFEVPIGDVQAGGDSSIEARQPDRLRQDLSAGFPGRLGRAAEHRWRHRSRRHSLQLVRYLRIGGSRLDWLGQRERGLGGERRSLEGRFRQRAIQRLQTAQRNHHRHADGVGPRFGDQHFVPRESSPTQGVCVQNPGGGANPQPGRLSGGQRKRSGERDGRRQLRRKSPREKPGRRVRKRPDGHSHQRSLESRRRTQQVFSVGGAQLRQVRFVDGQILAQTVRGMEFPHRRCDAGGEDGHLLQTVPRPGSGQTQHGQVRGGHLRLGQGARLSRSLTYRRGTEPLQIRARNGHSFSQRQRLGGELRIGGGRKAGSEVRQAWRKRAGDGLGGAKDTYRRRQEVALGQRAVAQQQDLGLPVHGTQAQQAGLGPHCQNRVAGSVIRLRHSHFSSARGVDILRLGSEIRSWSDHSQGPPRFRHRLGGAGDGLGNRYAALENRRRHGKHVNRIRQGHWHAAARKPGRGGAGDRKRRTRREIAGANLQPERGLGRLRAQSGHLERGWRGGPGRGSGNRQRQNRPELAGG